MEKSENSGSIFDFRVFEATPGISVIVRPRPSYTLVATSNDFNTLVGLQRNDIIGKNYFHFFNKHDDLHVRAEQTLIASFDYTFEHKISHEIPVLRFDLLGKNGVPTVRYWKIKNVPLLGDAGEIVLIIHSIVDITEKIIQEGGVEPASIQKSYKFFMNAPVIIGYVRGANYIIEFANEGLLRVWNKTKEVIGKPLFNVFPELEAQGTKQLLDEVCRTGKPFFAYEHPLHFDFGGKVETLYFDFVYQPYYESEDERVVSGIISVGHDVTEQIKARQSQRALEELKYANKKLQEFAYAASHDLKEPVRKIISFSCKLRAELMDLLDHNHNDLFDRLENSSRRMQNLIDDLLEYSHAAQGFSEQEEIELHGKIKNVLEDLELEIQKKHATIRCDSLPTIMANKRQMQQLFQNLISNALKYSKPDVAPEIHISSKVADKEVLKNHLSISSNGKQYYLIEVSDNGIGFEQKDAVKIFNVFTRLHNASQYKGTGIGLSIVQKVVESHGGSVWAHSEPGKGSTFKILLPAG